MTRILIISSDKNVLREMNNCFMRYGFQVNSAASIKAAWELLEDIYFKLIVMDPQIEGKEELISETKRPPILFVSANFKEVPPLRFGDDFLIRPVAVSDFQNVINRLLEQKRQRFINVGELHLDAARNLMKVKDSIISLGMKEMEVMMMLAVKAGKMVHKNQLMTIERMTHLKRKIEQVGGDVLELKSVGNAGYKLLWMNQG